MRRPITAPVLHLNGSSKAALREDLESAHAAVTAALEALSITAPNARDYYLRPGTWEQATREHVSRLDRLQTVRAELMEIWEAIENQEGR